MTIATDAVAAAPTKVLIVDDQRIVAEAVRRMLAPEGDLVLTWCGEASAALETARTLQPDGNLAVLVQSTSRPVQVLESDVEGAEAPRKPTQGKFEPLVDQINRRRRKARLVPYQNPHLRPLFRMTRAGAEAGARDSGGRQRSRA